MDKNILSKKRRLNVGLAIILSFLVLVGKAQYNTATINSDIGTSEYGTSNANSYVSGGTTWYMSWDASYLYVSIQNANETEAAIMYFDVTPATPVNGTTGATGGTTVGIAYDGLGAPNLPFSANVAIYVKNNYREFRRWNGTAWTTVNSGDGGLSGNANDYSSSDYSSNNRGNGAGGDDDREMRISWNRLTNGSTIPASFNWNGYMAYSNGRYSPAPLENPSGTLGSGVVASDVRYFTVTSTADGSATNPISRNCYTHPDSDNNSFGAIGVWDFTMNRSGRTITRTGGAWTISGTLRIDAGIISFGTIGTGNACTVGDLFNAGTLTLSSSIGGDITVQGNITDNGTFNANNRAIFFSGSNVQTIQGSGTFDIPYVRINKSGGRVVLGSNLTCVGPNGGNGMEIDGTNSILDLNGYSLILGQNTGTTNATFNSGIATPGTIRGSSNSSISILGTGALGTIFFDQTTPGTTNLLKNFTVDRTSSGSVTLGNAVNIVGGSSSGVVTITNGTLNTGGFLTLKSNALGTASIAALLGSISGNVTVERFIAGQSVRGRWRFLSSPVQGQTVANWMSQFYVTGPGDGTTLGAANSNGWHTNQANIDFPNSTFGSDSRSVKTTSIRTYTESTSGNLDLGWINLTGTSQSLAVGQGFRAYIRGPISGGTSQLGSSANSNIQGAVTLSLTGTINSGNISMPVSATATGAGSTFDAANDGWNLLGNPYPCAYDFNAYHAAGRVGGTSGTSGTNYTNINPVVHVFDASANGYKSYNAASGGTLTSGIIPSGASFFVQASGTGASMTFTEAFKTTSNAPIAVHKGAKNDEFTIKYSKDSTENDEFMIKMLEGSTLNKELYDIGKLRNENLNLSSYGEDTLQLTLSAIPLVNGETRIKLNVEATQVGTYKFEFKNIENFDAGVSVHLYDKFTNTTTDVKANTLYSFEMGAAENQWGKNRFELILNGKATTGINDNIGGNSSITSTNLSVYPNPATDALNINISNANFKNSEVVVYNISGAEVFKTNMASSNAQLNIESLSNGVYFVKVSNQNGFNKTVKFVK